MDISNLAKEIAAYRSTMNRLSKGKSLSDPEVIRLRQGLDKLIYKYYCELRLTSVSKESKFIQS